MHRTLVCVIVAMAATISAHAGDTAGPNLDIAGIKVGMGVKEAMAALKAENPHFTLTMSSQPVEGFSEPLQPTAIARQQISPGNDGETITLALTTPPGREAVWGIKRDTTYRTQNQPSTENTLAALRAKYGPENIPPFDQRTQNLAWVFDEKGKPLPADQARQFWMSCCTILQNHFTGEVPLLNDLATGRYGPPECSSIILITANVQSGQVTPGSPFVVNNLSVAINHGPMYRTAVEATREVAQRAVRSRENKATEDANKVGVPKL
jgi:hypothetical protein